jgi:hypothetical protein
MGDLLPDATSANERDPLDRVPAWLDYGAMQRLLINQ